MPFIYVCKVAHTLTCALTLLCFTVRRKLLSKAACWLCLTKSAAFACRQHYV